MAGRAVSHSEAVVLRVPIGLGVRIPLSCRALALTAVGGVLIPGRQTMPAMAPEAVRWDSLLVDGTRLAMPCPSNPACSALATLADGQASNTAPVGHRRTLWKTPTTTTPTP